MSEPKPRAVRVRTVALAVMILAVLAGLVVIVLSQQSSRTSAVVVEHVPELGSHWLKANLDDAVVIVPDRPHDRAEFTDDWTGFTSAVTRTRSFTVRTNAQRLRGGPVGPKQGTRIIALGDSVTHGWGVAEDHAYPARLQAVLADAGLQAQVLNAGVPANRIGGMVGWCEQSGEGLAPDWILWTRRPGFDDPPPHDIYVDAVRRCAWATGARVLVVLPPVSTFDLHGGAVWSQEQRSLTERLGAVGIRVLELTPVFRQAGQGQGEVAVVQDGTLRVMDQATGTSWLDVPVEGERLPQAVYDLFEDEPDVREALFFDDGHPDRPGYDLMARTVAEQLIPSLRRGEGRLRAPREGPSPSRPPPPPPPRGGP